MTLDDAINWSTKAKGLIDIGQIVVDCNNRGWDLISQSTGSVIITTSDRRRAGGDKPRELASSFGFEEPDLADRIRWTYQKAIEVFERQHDQPPGKPA